MSGHTYVRTILAVPRRSDARYADLYDDIVVDADLSKPEVRNEVVVEGPNGSHIDTATLDALAQAEADYETAKTNADTAAMLDALHRMNDLLTEVETGHSLSELVAERL